MGDDTFLGLSRDQQNALLFVLGIAFVLVGATFAGALGGFDVVVRLAGYVMIFYAPVAFLYDRILG